MEDQINQIKEVINKISSPGDVAAALLGGAAGLAIDIFALHLGIPPGYMTFLGLSTALGGKKAVDAWIQSQNEKALTREQHLETIVLAERTQKQLQSGSSDLKERADKLYELIKEEGNEELLHRFEKLYKLWQDGLTSNEKFDKKLENFINEFSEEDS